MRTRCLAALLATALVACTGDDELTKEEVAAMGDDAKADGADECAIHRWYGDGTCDTFCPDPDPDCLMGSSGGGAAGDSTPACDGGELFAHENAAFTDDPASGLECAVTELHCLTSDSSACPQLVPPAPTFCSAGTIKIGAPRFAASSDGKECELPAQHCVTNDPEACPGIPLPPLVCPGGHLVVGPPTFVPSSDGMECQVPNVHCVSSACPAS
jgi:hypothetical protein